jgi:hydrogenase maturation protease
VTRFVCLGQRHAGDDGVGLLVGERLAERGFEVAEARDAADLVEWLAGSGRVVLVDAIVGAGPPGTVLHLGPDAIESERGLVSSHAFSVRQAVALARALHGDEAGRDLHVVAIAIASPTAGSSERSPAVEAAVDPAADLAIRLA